MRMRRDLTSVCTLFSMGLLVSCAPVFEPPPLTATSPPSATSPAPTPPLAAALPTQIDPSSSWIEIDLAGQTVVLHEGSRILAEYPAASGVMSDLRYATPPGL